PLPLMSYTALFDTPHKGILRLRSPHRTTLAPEGPAPRRCHPSARMFREALWSRWRLVPHSGQECQRTHSPFWTTTPQPEHVWLVSAGGTATSRFPAVAALRAHDAQECAPPHLADALGEVVVLEQVGRLHVLVIERVVRANERGLVVEVLALALHLLMRFGAQRHRLAAPVAPF